MSYIRLITVVAILKCTFIMAAPSKSFQLLPKLTVMTEQYFLYLPPFKSDYDAKSMMLTPHWMKGCIAAILQAIKKLGTLH